MTAIKELGCRDRRPSVQRGMQPSTNDRAASPAGLMRLAYYPDSSVSTDWIAAFLTDLLVPLSDVQAAERDLWTLWGRAAEPIERGVLDLAVDLADGCETLATPTLRDTSQRAYAELQEHLSGTAWEAAIQEFKSNPLVPARTSLNQAVRLATPEPFATVPYWSIVLRLVDATTATVAFEGADVVLRNLRGRVPSPRENSARRMERTEPCYQLLECHSLSVQPWIANSAHLAYNVRARQSHVPWRKHKYPATDDEVAFARHKSSRGSQSTECNTFRLPSVVIDQRLEADDRTFCEGFHGWLYIMDTVALLEPLTTLP